MTVPSDLVLERLARRVAARLRAGKELIVTAESCTGGYLAKCLTDLAGSSDYFDRGWVTYSNSAKVAELGVGLNLIDQRGAVSESVALAMVRGALRSSRADHGISVTGIAGPAGGTPEKPVGTVWIAWGSRARGRVTVEARHFHFTGGRDAIRRRTVAAALRGFLTS